MRGVRGPGWGGGGCRSERKAAKGIFRALRSERIVWESELITGQTGWGMGRHGEGLRGGAGLYLAQRGSAEGSFAREPLASETLLNPDRPRLTRRGTLQHV